jgi:transposase
VLDGEFELVLANVMHVKHVPGRKTDVNDATWIADLLAHGLIRSSFVPPTPIQELRMLTRTRKQLVRERASHAQRVDKILQDANLKLGSVLTDIMGQSGGRSSPRSSKARPRPRSSPPWRASGSRRRVSRSSSRCGAR